MRNEQHLNVRVMLFETLMFHTFLSLIQIHFSVNLIDKFTFLTFPNYPDVPHLADSIQTYKQQLTQ